MSTILEDLRIRLGVDGSQVDPEMQKFENRVKQGAEQGGRWFEHIGSKARAFHKVLEQLSEASPVFGTALKFALDPAVATIGLLATGIGLARREIERYNQAAHESFEATSRALSDYSPATGARAGAEGRRGVSEAMRRHYAKPAGDNPILAALDEEKAKRDKMVEDEKRAVEDVFTLRKQKLEDEVKFREMMIRRLPDHLRAIATEQLQIQRTTAERKLELDKQTAHRAIDDRTREAQRASLQRARAKLGRDLYDSETDAMLAEVGAEDAAEGRQRQEIVKAGLPGLEREKQATEEALKKAKEAGVIAAMGKNPASDVGGTIINYGKMGVNMLNRMLGLGRLQYPLDTGKLTGGPSSTAQTDKTITDLEAKLRQLNHAIEAGKDLNQKFSDSEKDSNAQLEEKYAIVERLRQAYENLGKELRGLPQASTAPVIDPDTGGIAYRPIENKGGIAYRPLKGSLNLDGAVRPSGRTSPEQSPIEKLAEDMAEILEIAKGGPGLKVNLANITTPDS